MAGGISMPHAISRRLDCVVSTADGATQRNWHASITAVGLGTGGEGKLWGRVSVAGDELAAVRLSWGRISVDGEELAAVDIVPRS